MNRERDRERKRPRPKDKERKRRWGECGIGIGSESDTVGAWERALTGQSWATPAAVCHARPAHVQSIALLSLDPPSPPPLPFY